MHHSSLVICLALVGLFFNSIVPPQSATKSLLNTYQVQDTHTQVKTQILPSMREAAKKEGLSIDESRLFYGSVNDGLVATVPAVGVEKIATKDFANGQNIGLLYSSAAIMTPAKKEIPAGVYVARIVGDPSMPNAKGQLLQSGKVVAEATIQKPCNPPPAKMAQLESPPFRSAMAKLREVQNQPSYENAFFNRQNELPMLVQADAVTTRCYGFVMYCRLAYPGGYYSDRWYWCGFCFGFWW